MKKLSQLFPIRVSGSGFAAVTDASSLFTLANKYAKISIAGYYFHRGDILWSITLLLIWIAATKKKSLKPNQKMIYGIIALFVMVSVWGLVNVLSGTSGFTKLKRRHCRGLPTQTYY